MVNRRFTWIPICVLCASAVSVSAGDLNPPAGVVAPTHKTLTEVEPRIAINATNTPGNVSTVFRITQPGSYYLTGNVTGAAGKIGIEIASSGVAIDLMGYSLTGVAGSLSGIGSSVVADGTSIRNGVVREWGGSGINISGVGHRIEGVDVQNNAAVGMTVGSGAVVRFCTAVANGTQGFVGSGEAVFESCTARQSVGQGFLTGGGAALRGCTARENSIGIAVSNGSMVDECSVFDNSSDGITGTTGVTVSGCTAYGNQGDGIQIGGSCLVVWNTCSINGAGAGSGAGIHASGSDNRIERNNCTGADRGIDVDLAGNIIVCNTCAGNTTNWDIVANNVVGPILDRTVPASAAILGNTAPDSTGSTHPNANFSY